MTTNEPAVARGRAAHDVDQIALFGGGRRLWEVCGIRHGWEVWS